jgi:RNA polymerase sigma-70 factor (ECF subfamily)
MPRGKHLKDRQAGQGTAADAERGLRELGVSATDAGDNSYDESHRGACGPQALDQLNAEVVAALYVAHSEELRRFLQALLRDAQLAADCLQSTFARLVERGHETREEARKAWLFRVAYHEAMLFRRRQAIGDKVLRNVAWTRDDVTHSAEESAVRLEAVDEVRHALEQLPPDHRQVVRMRVYDGKTFAVIAKELRIPLGTALGRMRTALIKLRKALNADVADEGLTEDP